MDAFSRAATNRSIRTIKTELDFLLECSLLTSEQVSSIHALLPSSAATPSTQSSHTPVPAPSNNFPSLASLRTASPLNEKSPLPQSLPFPQPPSYVASAGPPPIATASALYAYSSADAGDMQLQPSDRVAVLEYMNADWARGRNERSGQEGIFPRSYVRVEEEKKSGGFGGFGGKAQGLMGPPPAQGSGGGGYGNAPLEVSQGGGGGGGGGESKVNGTGKKIGKKVGNAALFGAGATIGSNIVNSIF